MKKNPSVSHKKRIPSFRKKTVRTSNGNRAYAIVTFGRKDVVLVKWNTKASKQEYDRVIPEWLAGGTGENDRIAEISVSEICFDYTREMKKRYRDESGKPTEEFKTVQRIMKLVRSIYGDTNAAEFKALRFKAMREKIIETGVCRYVVNKYCRHIIRAFKLAAENEKLSAENYNSLKAVESLRKGRPETKETEPIKVRQGAFRSRVVSDQR